MVNFASGPPAMSGPSAGAVAAPHEKAGGWPLLPALVEVRGDRAMTPQQSPQDGQRQVLVVRKR